MATALFLIHAFKTNEWPLSNKKEIKAKNINLRLYKMLMRLYLLLSCCGLVLIFSCNSPGNNGKTPVESDDKNVLQSVITNGDTLKTFDFVNVQSAKIKAALQQPMPVLLCQDSLNDHQKLAQLIALSDTIFTESVRRKDTRQAYRCEIFGVYPARETDMAYVKTRYNLADCYRVDLYNYALNSTATAITDIKQQKVIGNGFQLQAQPDIPLYLKNLALKIAVSSAEVQQALGMKPEESSALMASTKTSLNRTRCERSGHLCVAPTFVKGDKALWAIVDITDYKLAGIRWTNTGTTGPAPAITEKKLQDDKITACFCELQTSLEKDGWKMDYMLTSSDGLRITGVLFNGRPVLQSAKLVDWHVSYSGTDGFGYSDAVGCPYFSQAAVVAFEPPKIAVLKEDNTVVGFALEQTFKSGQWPSPCNYNYVQRYEFYKDGRFRVAAASLGRGCGNDATYRPVFRIAFAAEQNNFAEWNGTTWNNWAQEKWQLQQATTAYTAEGYEYKLTDNTGAGYYIEPGKGQFKDGGRGDNAYVYATASKPATDEGEADLVTIGPCCNIDYHQGPEKYIEPSPDDIRNKKIVVWYVAQLKNDNAKGNEYCWAESVLENGVYVTRSYPCFCGPLFVPVK
ncbi:MAG: hypothetical protein ABIR15_06985 [Chitinophagaceae bacterium]